MSSRSKIKSFLQNHGCFGGGGVHDADVRNITRESEAADKLQGAILKAVNKINFPSGLGCSNAEIVNGIRQRLDASAFDRHNQDYGIVEARATFHATKGDGSTVFHLVIIWDADVPPADSNQNPHFGWEIYMDNSRAAGPSHVFFKEGKTLKHYRMPGLEQVEEHGLKMGKTGTMGTGNMASETHYFKLARP